MKLSISVTVAPIGAIAVIFLLPVAAGIVNVFLPAFGYLPALGHTNFDWHAWQAMLATPGLLEMMGLSLWVGIISTLVSLLLALGFVSSAWGTKSWQHTTKWLSPIMATPHVALAFGLSFLIIPSGFLGRLIAPLAGWQYPPDWQTVQDPLGLSMIGLLILKETPFLIFMLMGAIERLPVRSTMDIAQSLGYQPWISWMKLLWPRLYPMIRMPVFTVLAFSVSVVDVALILGPNSPPVFSVQILQWLQDPDLTSQFLAAAGSLGLAALVLLAIGIFLGLEKLAIFVGRPWIHAGGRGQLTRVWCFLSHTGWRFLLAIFTGAVLSLILWSFVWRWRFPSLWPGDLSLRSWQKAAPYLFEPLYNSLLIGCVSSLISIGIAVLLLELMDKASAKLEAVVEKMMYLPMLLPQISFLFGIQMLLLKLNLDGQQWTVIFVHSLFVLPYCYLSLAGPWRHFDNRQTVQAWLLSHSRIRSFWQVKIPMLWRPLMASFALGFAVSIAQYLPTLFAGAGRISTVTTEAVSLVSGGNRRLTGVYGLVQMLLPILVYGLAMLSASWSLLKFRRRLVQ